jgi:hypothetical protein
MPERASGIVLLPERGGAVVAKEAGERKMKSSFAPRMISMSLACLVLAPAAVATLSVAARVIA